MRRSRTVRRSARAAWITRAEAGFVARVPVEEIDRRIAAGAVAHRRVGAVVLVDPSGLVEPARPPAEARSVRAARARPGRAPRRTTIVAALAGAATILLLVAQFTVSSPPPAIRALEGAAAPSSDATPPPGSIPVGRDPFASPFATQGASDRHGEVLVKPPGVVRDGDGVTAAATVVNRSDDRWMPPSPVTFVARDGAGRVLARKTATVSLGPGRAETVVAPDLGIDAESIAAIEASIHPARLRSGRYRRPSVSVATAAVGEGGKAIKGTLEVGTGAGASAVVSCAMFDSLDELVGVGTADVDLSSPNAGRGRMRFWLTAQPTKPGPYRVSCSAS
jgi:hypothetical protein